MLMLIVRKIPILGVRYDVSMCLYFYELFYENTFFVLQLSSHHSVDSVTYTRTWVLRSTGRAYLLLGFITHFCS